MLQEIGDVSRVKSFIDRARDPADPFRLMGFGHRVYKNYDPRARVMQSTAHEVLGALGKEKEPMFRLARELERIALEDDYFIEKKLYPNVDFYSGITLQAIGFPANLFTVLFCGRPNRRLGRPMERNDRGSRPADRPSPPAVHGRGRAPVCLD